jgi:hypothetical protein
LDSSQPKIIAHSCTISYRIKFPLARFGQRATGVSIEYRRKTQATSSGMIIAVTDFQRLKALNSTALPTTKKAAGGCFYASDG